jgi:hypothetical protein
MKTAELSMSLPFTSIIASSLFVFPEVLRAPKLGYLQPIRAVFSARLLPASTRKGWGNEHGLRE